MTALHTLHSVATLVVTAAPEDEDVVAGWTAFVIFVALILAVAVLGFSLTKRLKNVDKAAEAGLYDPSDPRKVRQREARGLAAARRFHDDQAEREQAERDRSTD
jgi:hypothetical protein